jgi:hypothetical protein
MMKDYKKLREWTLEKLERVRELGNDSDLNLTSTRREENEKEIDRHIELIRNGRYTVAFMGTFNVGKSTLINALIGQEVLPPLMEACTAKPVYLMHSGAEMGLTGKMRDELPSGAEDALGSLEMSTIRVAPDRMSFDMSFSSEDAIIGLRQILNKLITVRARDTSEELCEVAARLAEVHVRLPLPRWAEDIVLADTPGVNSISESEDSITYEIIPKANLVVFIFDSEHGGSKHDFDFMRRIVENRNRKLFFVINRRDQLEEDDIDPSGERGPGRTIKEGLKGFMRDPELFFVSALYALRSRQLHSGRISIDTIRNSRVIRLPWGVEAQLREDLDGGTKAVIECLVEESAIHLLEVRINDYLHKEDREKAVVAESLAFLRLICERYKVPLNRSLEAAKDPSKLSELLDRQNWTKKALEQAKTDGHAAFNLFNVKFAGGTQNGRKYLGLNHRLRQLFDDGEIESKVIAPMNEWLSIDANLKETLKDPQRMPGAKKRFLELIDDFQSNAGRALESELKQLADELLYALRKIVEGFEEDELGRLNNSKALLPPIDKSNSLVGTLLWGLTCGTVTGLAVLFLAPYAVPTAIVSWATGGAAAISGVLGILAAKYSPFKDKLRKNLERQFQIHALGILRNGLDLGGKPRILPIKEAFDNRLQEIRNEFDEGCRRNFISYCDNLAEDLDQLKAKEDEIRSNGQLIAERLEPKVELLSEVLSEIKAWEKI